MRLSLDRPPIAGQAVIRAPVHPLRLEWRNQPVQDPFRIGVQSLRDPCGAPVKLGEPVVARGAVGQVVAKHAAESSVHAVEDCAPAATPRTATPDALAAVVA